MNSYTVMHAPFPLDITGRGTDPSWAAAQALREFASPWQSQAPSPTVFRALVDEVHLHFLFKATDQTILSRIPDIKRRDVVDSDRVEIYIRSDATLDPYYSLEIDPTGRVLDYRARYHRQFDTTWNWPADHLKVLTSVDEGGYTVEGSVTLDSLRELRLVGGDRCIEAGLFRAEYRSSTDDTWVPQWISWVTPEAPTPDFHVPTAFGRLHLAQPPAYGAWLPGSVRRSTST